MPNIFSVDQSFIKSLDDKIARELVARLCRAELRKQYIPDSVVTWGGDQRAKDGGVDIRVDSIIPMTAPNFIKAQCCIFQIKAEKFPPSKIPQEMAPHNTLRSAISELSTQNGAYIIVSTKDDVSDEGLKSRKAAIQECLNTYGFGSSILFDFYDSRRIADWIEEHPSVATWLRYQVNQQFCGWKPYGPWAYNEDNIHTKYFIDDCVRVFIPNIEEGMNIKDAILELRKELCKHDSVAIRIIGLSGVGKTRLVQALFDQRVCANTKSTVPSSENVIYTDLGDDPKPTPQLMLEHLLNHVSNSIMVVDNCGAATHKKLADYIKSKKSHLKLITIEYDIRDDLPENTSCYRLEGTTPDTIRLLIKEKYSHLSDNDVERIAHFSDGNARVAYALACTVEVGGELSRLRDRKLFERLFQQKNDPDDSLLRCAEAASLLYSFDGDDLSKDGELAKLAQIAEVSPLTFSRQMAELKRRGLLQVRAQWRAILPHAISNALAMRALEAIPVEYIIQIFVEQGGQRLTSSFTHRLSFLHDSPQAENIASYMMSAVGPLGNFAELNSFEEQMVVNLAPVNPKDTLEAIKRAMDNTDFLIGKLYYRNEFARLARAIAYEPLFFQDAISILIKFTLAEPKNTKREKIKDLLTSLFHCYFSGTKTTPLERLVIVERLLVSENINEHILGVDLLCESLNTNNFRSHYGFSFGARKRDYGWFPQSKDDINFWYCSWFKPALSIGMQNSQSGRQVRQKLGESLRALWGIGIAEIEKELIVMAGKFVVIDGWPEGWLGIKCILQWDKMKLSEESLINLQLIEGILHPNCLLSQIRALILNKNYSFSILNDEEIKLPIQEQRLLVDEKATLLGIELSKQEDIFKQLIPELCKYERSGLYELGIGLGLSSVNVYETLEKIHNYLKTIQHGDVSLMLVRGIINSWMTRDSVAVEEFLDRAVNDNVWNKWFVELQWQTELRENAFKRLAMVLEAGSCPSYQFGYLAMGKATEHFTIPQIMFLVNELLEKDNEGYRSAFSILSRVIFVSKNRSEEYQKELHIVIKELFFSLDWRINNKDNVGLLRDFCEVLEFTLKNKNSDSCIEKMLHRMLSTIQNDWYHFESIVSKAISLFFQNYPKISLDIICKADADGSYDYATLLISEPMARYGKTALELVPTQLLLNWYLEAPLQRFEFVADSCQLFQRVGEEEKRLRISDTAIALLEVASNKTAMMDRFLNRFTPSSYSGSLVRILDSRFLLLDEFIIAGNEEVALAVQSAKVKLQEWINNEETLEHERQQMEYLSFE